MTVYDVAIVGAGIAGASLAAELAPHLSVLILEAEDRPGYHATGRSAAFWHETYGGPDIQPLSRASFAWLAAPPPEAGGESFLAPRGAITIARAGDAAKLQAYVEEFAASGLAFEPLDAAALAQHCPGLKPEWSLGLLEPDCRDIEVAGLHQAYLRIAAQAGAVLQCRAQLDEARFDGSTWKIGTRQGAFQARILVDAAGAWADDVARRAGATPLGIAPFRRTMVQLRVDPPAPVAMPLTIDVDGSFYFKPDGGGGLWLSPHDEIPTDPCDAAPDEIDIAVAIDRFEQAVDWRVRGVTHKWAGLRSFAPDRLPVYGFDARAPGFFWFAGQGGFGIQTAPAAAKIGAHLILGAPADPMVSHIDAGRYAPSRFTSV